jgi:hypothetical protein
MSLPSAVAAQGARADELLQKAAAARNGNTEQPAPASPTTTASETPKETAAPATSTPSPTPAPASDAEHKLKVLKGKYDAEVPRLAAAAKAEREAREKAERELDELRKKQNSQPLVTPEEVKEFGEPLVDLARRIAREENRATVEENEKLKKRLEEVSAQVTTTAQVGASLNTNAFFSTLDAKHSDWRVVNDDPAFLAWMGETDPLYGRTRQEILDEAQNELDANRVARSSRRSRQTFSRGLLRALKLSTIKSCRQLQRRFGSGTRRKQEDLDTGVDHEVLRRRAAWSVQGRRSGAH